MHQYLFFIGGFPVRAYGLLLALGIISAAIVGYFIMKKDGRGWEKYMVDFTITVAIAGIIGARLWDVFSLIGAITTIICWKYLLCGKVVWLFRVAYC